MKIIEQARAPNPRRVRIFLAEKGISVPFEPLDIMKLEHRTEAYRKLNPSERVPTLVLDDGTAISESVAICRYFEEIQPAPALFGTTPLQRAQIEMWQRRIELGLFEAVAQCFRHTHPAMASLEGQQFTAWGEANRTRAPAQLAMIDAELGLHRFVAGDAYSIADITLLVAIDFMKPARIDRPVGLANVTRWYDEVSSRPSAKA